MSQDKLYFVASGGMLFYFFGEDITENKNNEITLKKAFYLLHSATPLMTPQGPALQVITTTFRFDNVKLKYEAWGEVPKDSAIYKAIMENQTGLKLV